MTTSLKFQTTEQIIDQWVKEKHPSKRGPFSNSRINRCNLEFWKHYEDEQAEGTDITRFGRDEGTAGHNILEVDVRMRIHRSEEDWLSVEELVDYYIDQNPDHDYTHAELTESLRLFRDNFTINEQDYVGSEDRLGCTLDMKPAEYEGDDQCWYRGRIDYMEVSREGVAWIPDFKNYPTIHKQKDIDDHYSDIGKQLMGYAALVMANNPSVKAVQYGVYYIRFGTTRTSKRWDKELGKSVPRFVTREQVEHWWKFRQREMIAIERRHPKNFNPQPSRKNCQYCSYMHECPFWNIRDPKDEFVIEDWGAAVEMMNEYIVLDEARKRMRDAMDTWAEEFGTIENELGKWYGYEKYESESPNMAKFLKLVAKKAGVDDSAEVRQFINQIQDSGLGMTKRGTGKFLKNLPDELQEEAEDAYDVTITSRKQTSF